MNPDYHRCDESCVWWGTCSWLLQHHPNEPVCCEVTDEAAGIDRYGGKKSTWDCKVQKPFRTWQDPLYGEEAA